MTAISLTGLAGVVWLIYTALPPCVRAASFEERQLALGRCMATIEIAASPDQILCGLMHREVLAMDAGMLFILDPAHPAMFWMKNTLIPLEIAFLGPEGELLGISAMQPHDLEVTEGPTGTAFALEVNPGYLAQCGMEPGGVIKIDL